MSETNGGATMKGPTFLPKKVDLAELVVHWEHGGFASRYPALYELLSLAKIDGHFRAGASLSLFCEGGHLKASIYDRASQMLYFVVLEGDGDCLEELDRRVQRGEGEWRSRKGPGR